MAAITNVYILVQLKNLKIQQTENGKSRYNRFRDDGDLELMDSSIVSHTNPIPSLSQSSLCTQ